VLADYKCTVPVVYNSSGYEKAESLKSLEGLVDIYLPDLKYVRSEKAKRYSDAEDYFTYASKALIEMKRQCGENVFDENGMMQKGVILRHLVLPSHRDDSINLLERVAERFDVSKFKLSLMSQYTPDFYDGEDKALRRKITTFEYQSVVDRAIELGYDGYIQEKTSAKRDFTPSFKGEIYEN
jgi:putative pyruvate formate lyase activating enzyme